MKRLITIAVGILVTLWGSHALGNATIESNFKSGGIKGMGATEGTTVRRYQSGKMWESTSSKFTGAILSRIAGGTEEVMITRLDKGIIWQLDPKKKTFSEQPIRPFDPKEIQKDKEEKPRVRITKSEFSVKKTGGQETINGFPCEEYLVTWVLEVEDLETKERSKSTMMTNLWTTPETATIRKAQAEEQAFHKAYAQKLGIALSPEEGKQLGMAAVEGLLGASREEMEKGWGKVKSEMAKVKGFPIRTVVNWSMEGDPSKAAPRAEGQTQETASSPTAEVGKLLSGFMSKITQKKGEEKPSAGREKETAFFSSTTEVKSINVDSIPAAVFEIPAGYEKK